MGGRCASAMYPQLPTEPAISDYPNVHMYRTSCIQQNHACVWSESVRNPQRKSTVGPHTLCMSIHSGSPMWIADCPQTHRSNACLLRCTGSSLQGRRTVSGMPPLYSVTPHPRSRWTSMLAMPVPTTRETQRQRRREGEKEGSSHHSSEILSPPCIVEAAGRGGGNDQTVRGAKGIAPGRFFMSFFRLLVRAGSMSVLRK